MLAWYCNRGVVVLLSPAVLLAAPGRRGDDAAEALHADGDGARPDGAQPVQRAADGAAGGRAVDRDDPVRGGASAHILQTCPISVPGPQSGTPPRVFDGRI